VYVANTHQQLLFSHFLRKKNAASPGCWIFSVGLLSGKNSKKKIAAIFSVGLLSGKNSNK
jgi:hypothetical protein